MKDSEKIAYIRQMMPVTQQSAYLNTGSAGPLSQIGGEALQTGLTTDMDEGRANMPGFISLLEAKTIFREKIAALINASPGEIALTQHTTHGMNIITHGLAWQPGDEIVTTNLEHQGGLIPLYVIRERFGVIIKVVHLNPDDSPETIVVKFKATITPRTRLFAFSHVAWNTGQRLPLTDIVALAHQHHILCLVDAAQSIGAIPVDVAASAVDFYAMPSQKWLCGMEGSGTLYIRQDKVSQIAPTFVGFLSLKDPSQYDLNGYYMPAANAQRYEMGTVFRPMVKAMATHLTWLEEEIGWAWIYERVGNLADYLQNALKTVPHVQVITPSGKQSGLTTFLLEGYDPPRVVTKLDQEGIIIRYIGQPYALRVSTGFYNTEADIDRLIATLKTIAASDPDSLPHYVSPF